MDRNNLIQHLNKLSERDERTDLSFLQASFEWAKRRRGLTKLPLLVWTAPFALTSGSGFMGVTATFYEKYCMSTDRDLAFARYFERQANKAGETPDSNTNNNTQARAYRSKFQDKYKWHTNYDKPKTSDQEPS